MRHDHSAIPLAHRTSTLLPVLHSLEVPPLVRAPHSPLVNCRLMQLPLLLLPEFAGDCLAQLLLVSSAAKPHCGNRVVRTRYAVSGEQAYADTHSRSAETSACHGGLASALPFCVVALRQLPVCNRSSVLYSVEPEMLVSHINGTSLCFQDQLMAVGWCQSPWWRTARTSTSLRPGSSLHAGGKPHPRGLLVQ